MTEVQMSTERDERAMLPEMGVTAAIAKAELDQAIVTARAFPRSVTKFRKDCMALATLNEKVADECFYTLPKRGEDGKPIEGPSIRMAEILLSAWGNCRAAARIIEEGSEFVTVQGVFMDLERNSHCSVEVRRRIVNREGRRYNVDMISTTANAGCSIAIRNAITHGIPQAFWQDIYEAARAAAVGNLETLAAKRAEIIDALKKLGATDAQIFATVGVQGVSDIGLDQLATLKGLCTAIKDGDITLEQAMTSTAKKDEKPATAKKGVDGLAARVNADKPTGDGKLTPKQELAHDCGQFVSQLGWDADAVKAALAENGVPNFTKWGDLDEAQLLKLRTMLDKQVKAAQSKGAAQ